MCLYRVKRLIPLEKYATLVYDRDIYFLLVMKVLLPNLYLFLLERTAMDKVDKQFVLNSMFTN